MNQTSTAGVTGQLSFRPEEQNGHADTVPDSSGSGAEKYVGQKAVSMCAHGHQIASLPLDPFDDFLGRFTVRQFGLCGNTDGLELGPQLFPNRRCLR